jgi:co-chaperonin GroES (HSP10)
MINDLRPTTNDLRRFQSWPSFVLGDRSSSRAAESKKKRHFLPDSAKEKPVARSPALGDGKPSKPANAPRSPSRKAMKSSRQLRRHWPKLDGEELMIMSEDDILAVVE